jgi:hypothetical protein
MVESLSRAGGYSFHVEQAEIGFVAGLSPGLSGPEELGFSGTGA